MKKAIEIVPRTISIGNGSLLVTTADFVNGYQAGHLACLSGEMSSPLFTDGQLIDMMMSKLEDVHHTEPYCMGYVVGWISTFTRKGQPQRGARPGEDKHDD